MIFLKNNLMGTPTDPYPADWGFGDDCPACTPEMFITSQTPLYIRVVFSGIVKCVPEADDPPNGRIFTMRQTPGWPCAWACERIIDGVEWHAHYDVDHNADGTLLVLWWKDFVATAFHYLHLPDCQGAEGFEFTNDQDCVDPIGHLWGNGVAHVWWDPDDIPDVLSSQYHFTTLAGNLYDRGFCGIHHQWIRIANKKDKTNVHFYIDNQEFEPYD